MQFSPLYVNDNKARLHLDKAQLQGLALLKEDIQKKKLVLRKNRCLCNNTDSNKDILISEKDRYGLPIPQILCSKCGIIRSQVVFDDSSNNLFYEKYYRTIYTTKSPSESFFREQQDHGKQFINLLEDNNILPQINDVVEIGCGAGGILKPFKDSGKNIKGFDFDQQYLNFGIKEGLSLFNGDYTSFLKDESCDLIILSHVLEHFLNPIEEIWNILKKIRVGKYLLVEIPGIYNIKNAYVDPLLYFQNAHIYNFHEKHLRIFFESFNLKVIVGDETAIFVCQKQSIVKKPSYIYNDILEHEVTKEYNYLVSCKKSYQSIPNLIKRKHLYEKSIKVAYNLACIFGWKKIRRFVPQKIRTYFLNKILF